MKFHENPSNGSRVVACGRTDRRTDMTKLIVDFLNFSNAPKKCTGDAPGLHVNAYRLTNQRCPKADNAVRRYWGSSDPGATFLVVNLICSIKK